MLKKLMQRINKEQKGITGLETAIILIAFVVVAAVFAYTVLSAGLYSTQKSQEAVYSGLEEARSSMELNGGVIAVKGTTGVDQITFTVMNALSGAPLDFTVPPNNPTVISYLDTNQRSDDLTWTLTKLGSSDTDSMLEADEKFQITVTGLEAALNPDLLGDTTFTLEVKPAVGAVLVLERTTAKTLDAVMNLH